ncbi:MAG TPA: PQQ-binding-like beta-propeller repeat protein, partial [Arenicellales bacterium]|nr:PQQ-binding-like beta-propeller repeat protein [Arenicellales bacterium]
EDIDGDVVAFEWTSDIDGLLSTSKSFDSDTLSVGAHTISFRVQDDDGSWSDYAYQNLMILEEEIEDKNEFPWNYTTGDDVNSVSISGNGEYIVAGSDDYKVYLFNKNSSTPLWSYTAEDSVNSVAISADGEYIVAGGKDDYIYFFDKDSSTPLWSYNTADDVGRVSISADGEYIAAGSYDKKVYLFGKDSGTPLWSYEIGGGVSSVAISADGEYIAAAGEGDTNVYLFDKDSSTPLRNYTIEGDIYCYDFVASCVAISADGKYIVVGNDVGQIHLLDKSSSTPLWSYTVTGLSPQLVSVTISADGKYIAAGSRYDTVYLFDKDSSTPLWSYETGDTVYSVAISADGKYIVAGSLDRKVYLFDKDSGIPFWNYDTDHPARAVAISADGEYLTAGTTGDKVYAFENTALTSVGQEQQVDISPGTPVTLNTWEDMGLLLELVVGDIASGNVTVTSVDVTPPLPDNGILEDVGIYVSISMDMTIQDSLDYANITLNFDTKLLPDGVIADTLQVYHYSDEGGWEASETGGIDLENGTVWGHFTNFSVFAVFGSNTAPVADAGPDLKITPGSQAVLFGTAVDADGTIALYEWDFDGDGVFDYSASDGVASHVYDAAGSYMAILRVTDNDGATGFDETVVTVSESSSLTFLDNPLFRIFFPTAILLLAVGYYAYRKYATFGAGALRSQKRKFEMKKEETITVVCPACGIHMKIPRLGTMQLVVCDNCGAEGEMEG